MGSDAVGAAALFPRPLQFVLAAIATGERRAGVRDMVLTDEEWAAVPEYARRHGVSAAVATAVSHHPRIPPAVQQALEQAHQLNAIHALQGLSELLRIVAALEAADIRAVALKGPAYSHWLYGDSSRRRFADLDVLIDPADRDRAYRVLQMLGYALPSGMPVDVARTIYGALGAWPLTGGGTYPLDLHWRLSHIRFATPLTAEQVISGSCPIELSGRRVRIPSPTHTAVLSLLHAAKHLWCTLEVIAGIAALTRRSEIDWMAVERLARQAHGWNGCVAGLCIASDLLGADMPVSLGSIDRAAGGPLAADAIAALLLPAGVFQDRWLERRAHRAAFDRSSDAVRYDLWRLIAPTPLEWEWWRLPARLRWLYVPVRLARLGTAAVRGALRSA